MIQPASSNETKLSEVPQKSRAERNREIKEAKIDSIIRRSVHDQIEYYGAELWQRDLIRVSDIKECPITKLDAERIQELVWSKLPNTRFKRFQEIFCDPVNYVVPQFVISKSQSVVQGRSKSSYQVSFPSRETLNNMTLKGVVVDPQRISDQLVNDLKLADLSKSKGKPLDRLEIKSDIAVVNRLKKIWESTTRLDHFNHRLLLIKADSKIAEQNYPGILGADPNNYGAILYTREHERSSESALQISRKIVQYFDSPADAHRKTIHEDNLYATEVKELARLRSDVDAFRNRLDMEWRGRDIPEETKNSLRQSIHELLIKTNDILSGCANAAKLEANDFIVKAATLEDKTGRESPAASLRRLVAAIDRFDSRLKEMRPKGGFNKQDEMLLSSVVESQSHQISILSDSIIKNAHILDSKLTVFGNTKLTGPQLANDVKGLLSRMNLAVIPWQQLYTKPFLQFRPVLESSFNDFKESLFERDRERAKESLVRAYVSLKFCRIVAAFDQIKGFIAEEQKVPLVYVRSFITNLRTSFDNAQLFSDIIVEDLTAPFNAMSNQLEEIEQLLDERPQIDQDIDVKTAIFSSLRHYLLSFEASDIVKQLTTTR